MSRQFINDADGKFKVPLKDDDKIVAYLLIQVLRGGVEP